MARFAHEISADVLTEARRRIAYTIDAFDRHVVNFSGGKDSLVVLHLLHEEYQRRGWDRPIDVVHFDIELIPTAVVEFVLEYAALPWISMYYCCLQERGPKTILGHTETYVQWDTAREWHRQPPPGAITSPLMFGLDGENKDDFEASLFPGGRLVAFNGVRCKESLQRYRSILEKLHEPWLTNASGKAGSVGRFIIGKPIFDWSEEDVFLYLWERQIRYCPVYDRQLASGRILRISGPMHGEAQTTIDNLAREDPELYGVLLRHWPDIAASRRYRTEIAPSGDLDTYGRSWQGVLAWVQEHVPDNVQPRVMSILAACRRAAERRPGDYTPRYVLKHLLYGAVQSGHLDMILPDRSKDRVTRRIEAITGEEYGRPGKRTDQ